MRARRRGQHARGAAGRVGARADGGRGAARVREAVPLRPARPGLVPAAALRRARQLPPARPPRPPRSLFITQSIQRSIHTFDGRLVLWSEVPYYETRGLRFKSR
jgi:hypothetical protein